MSWFYLTIDSTFNSSGINSTAYLKAVHGPAKPPKTGMVPYPTVITLPGPVKRLLISYIFETTPTATFSLTL